MNRYLIDTSSLLILARYYHPFDKDGILYELIRHKFKESVVILLDAVEEECRYIAQKKIVQTYQFLNKNISKDNKPIPNPEYAKPKSEPNKIATPAIHKKIANNWLYAREKNKLTAEQFETQKERAIQGADFQLIFAAMEYNTNHPNIFQGEIIIVTEETSSSDDSKLFHKIPKICEIEQIKCISITKMLKDFITLQYKTK